MTNWLPHRGADWVDLMGRAEGPWQVPNHGRHFVYSLSSTVLLTILVMVVIAMSALALGLLAGGMAHSTTTALP